MSDGRIGSDGVVATFIGLPPEPLPPRLTVTAAFDPQRPAEGELATVSIEVRNVRRQHLCRAGLTTLDGDLWASPAPC